MAMANWDEPPYLCSMVVMQVSVLLADQSDMVHCFTYLPVIEKDFSNSSIKLFELIGVSNVPIF